MKLNKKMYKEKKGITLVALVITIVILLILAGISIAQLTGNGLLKNAKLAKEKSQQTSEEENEILQEYQNSMEKALTGTSRNDNKKVIDENEHIIGTFYGKTLYQKSFTGITPSSNGELLDLSELNIDICTNIKGVVKDTSNIYATIPQIQLQANHYLAVFYNANDKTLLYRANASEYFNTKYYITIEYTKNIE